MSDYEDESCPHCNFPIYDEESLSCPMCGRTLDRSAGFISGLTKGENRGLGVFFALLILLGILWWLFSRFL